MKDLLKECGTAEYKTYELVCKSCKKVHNIEGFVSVCPICDSNKIEFIEKYTKESMWVFKTERDFAEEKKHSRVIEQNQSKLTSILKRLFKE